MNSFCVLRTNVGLTTNVKIMVTSDYTLYLDSIDSDIQLSSSQYKKFQFNVGSYYDEVVPNFFNGLPADIAFKVKYDNDNDIMFNSFDHQFDDTYQMGCRNIIDNKNYIEEFECFAPLYLGSDSIPKDFVIFRVDGPGLTTLNKDNFKSEIIDNLKCVKVFDLTKSSPLGEWIEKNYTKNKYFPESPFYMDFRNLEFSSWNGIDYEVGGYTSKSFFLDSTLQYENTFFDMEKMVYDGFKNNKVIFPNILNLSFLFNDTPATPDSLRTWSMNRYMGFYIDDMENTNNFTPYVLPMIKNDVVISSGNLLTSQGSDSPFVDNWSDISSPYVEVDGIFYKVEKYLRNTKPQSSKTKLSNTVYSDEIAPSNQVFYKIISDIDLSGLTYSSINTTLVHINSDNSIELVNGSTLIPEYDTADIWLIDIDNKYHIIKKVGDIFYIQSDYAFNMTSDSFQYWINSPDTNYKTTISLDINGNPNLIPFKVYRCKLTDIKDFDTSIVDTTYSKFEYDKSSMVYTDEAKMYNTNYDSVNNPKDYEDFIVDGKVTNIPSASEYTANGETFRLLNGDLSSIWRKNPIRSKWGYQNSLSSNDYPYLLNNSFLSEDFNRSTNPFDPIPNRKERNLDYFYTVNSSTYSYSYHSLHVESSNKYGIDTTFTFELNKYLDVTHDYFSYFFGKNISFSSGVSNTQKWSTFDKGDSIIPNTTLFRGLKFNLYDVEDIKSSGGSDTINLKTSNSYQGYKFSIILSKNDWRVTPSKSDISIGELSSTSNTLQWNIINKWSHGETYSLSNIVSYYDILYVSLVESNITDPKINPGNSSYWSAINTYTPTYSIFWTPNYTYSANDFVFNNNEYYYYDPTSGYTFWSPSYLYNYNDVVIFDNKTWISSTQSNTFQPNSSTVWNNNYYWIESNVITDWKIIEIWSPVNIYSPTSISRSNGTITNTPGNPYVIYNNVLYQLSLPPGYISSSDDFPDVFPNIWIRKYSMIPDTSYQYTNVDNPIILQNNRYYQCISNPNKSTLENGISIYVNKKYRNILINIYINDNTLPNLSNSDRDILYSDLYSNITAANFVNSISDVSNKFGFSDYLQYVVINEDGSLNTYNYNNINSLPYMITHQLPDQLFSRCQSLDVTSLSLESSQFKAKRQLENGNVSSPDMIDYYNNNSLSTQIDRRIDDTKLIDNYSGLKNNIYNKLYRHSGYYCPIFYSIPLFESCGVTSSVVGNYKFDTTLKNFGIVKERIISKINRDSNILKLRFNPDIKSIYPMIDEFGYTISDYFIFKSTWDNEYYIECLNVDQNG